jgi:putative phage-type endonuclease
MNNQNLGVEMTEVITPKNKAHWLELRSMDLTSTEVSALFGISPYTTLFELWHQKKEKTIIELAGNERMTWGTRLQDAIALGIAEDNGWKVRRMDEYIRNVKRRMGSSFDFEIIADGLLEIKNVDGLAFRNGWVVEDKEIEAPPHIEIQVQHQLAVSGKSFAYIGALIGGNRVELLKREPDKDIIKKIEDRVDWFWSTIEANTPPPPDFTKDAAFIAKLYNYAEPGKVLDLKGDNEAMELAREYKRLMDIEKAAEAGKKAIKAQFLIKIGDAEKVLGDEFTSISAGIIGPQQIEAHERAGYRNFRINWPRGKKE